MTITKKINIAAVMTVSIIGHWCI